MRWSGEKIGANNIQALFTGKTDVKAISLYFRLSHNCGRRKRGTGGM